MTKPNSFLSFFLALTVSVILLEGSIRIFAPQYIIPSFISTAFGIKNALKANFSGVSHHGPFPYKITIGSKHLRSNQESSYDKSAGTYRILCLGDSILFGYGVNNNETFSHYLEKLLNKFSNGLRYEVLNASAPGWGPVEYLLFLQNEGFKYQPDMIVTTKFVDDLTELPVDRIVFDDIHFESTDNQKKISLNGFHLKSIAKPNSKTNVNLSLYETVSQHSHLFNLIRYRGNQIATVNKSKRVGSSIAQWLTEQKIENMLGLEWILPNRNFTGGQIFQILADWGKGHPQQSSLDQISNLLMYFRVWDAIGQWSDSLNIKWLMLEIPTHQEVMGLVNEGPLVFHYPSNNFRNLNILRPFISYQKKTTIPLFFPEDNHWTPAGHLLAALISTRFLGKQNFVRLDIPFNFQEKLDFDAENLFSTANREIATRLDGHPKWLFSKALLLKNYGKPVLARKAFTKYLENAPGDAETLMQIGLLDLMAGKRNQAIQFIKQAASPNSKTHIRASLKLAEIYMQQNNFTDALQTLNKIQNHNKLLVPEIHNKMGQLYLLNKELEKAEYFFRMALESRPNSSGYRINYGNFLFIIGRYKEAITQFKFAIQSDPNRLLAFEGLGGAYLKIGDRDKAIVNFEKILRQDPKNETAIATLEFIKKNFGPKDK